MVIRLIHFPAIDDTTRAMQRALLLRELSRCAPVRRGGLKPPRGSGLYDRPVIDKLASEPSFVSTILACARYLGARSVGRSGNRIERQGLPPAQDIVDYR